MGFSTNFLDYINSQSRSKIKGGRHRETFLEIWIVEVNGRLFARSWNKSARSWFTAILDENYGEIAFEDEVIKINGTKVPEQSNVHDEIDLAYRTKYTTPYNLPYVEGITKEEYRNYTMEIIPINS